MFKSTTEFNLKSTYIVLKVDNRYPLLIVPIVAVFKPIGWFVKNVCKSVHTS